jgi:photosystem II stability/assembly factor-like uncharacterized protein
VSSTIRVAGLLVPVLVGASCTTALSPSTSSPRSVPTSRSMPSPSASPTPTAPTTSVEAFQLVSRSFGVAIVRRCLVSDPSSCRQLVVATEDFGRTWTNITPMRTVPGGLPADLALSHLFFLDPEHGWVTASDCVGGKAVLFRTASGGRRWGHTSIPASTCNAGAGTTPTFVDARHGWLLRQEPTGESASIQRTTDGGNRWSPERDFPWITALRFVDPLHGWLGGTGRPSTVGLFRTLDAGRTWLHVRTPLPSCCQGWWALFDAPTFFDASHGVVPVTLRHGNRLVVVFEATPDGGDTWRVAATLGPLRAGTIGFPAPASVSVATESDWWVLTGRRPRLRVTHDAGRSWRSIAVPNARRAYALDALDARRAWITVGAGRLTLLLATRDGGRTWRTLVPVARPNVPATSAAIRTVLPLPGPVTALAPGAGGIVYASYLPHPNGDRQVIVRFDPATGGVERSTPLPGGEGGFDRLAALGGSLWVSAGTRRVLYRLDARTLEVRERIVMSDPPGSLAAVPAGIWAASGRSVVLLDPKTGQAITTVTFAGKVDLLAVDPAGEHLYVSTTAPVRHDSTPILELEAVSGAILALAWHCCADLNGPSGLAATADGVWVTAPTGMMATLTFLRESDLHQGAIFKPGASNGLRAYAVNHILWVTDDLGGYYCADPANGRVLGHVGIRQAPSGISNIVSVGGHIYVGLNGVARLRPGPDCRR